MQHVQEQRLTGRLLKYWQLLRKTHAIPEMEQFNSDAVSDLWPQCFLLNVDTHGSVAYKYEVVGQSITTVYGRDLTGLAVDTNSKKFPGSIISKKLAETVDQQQPSEDHGHFVSDDGKMVKYRACFLPFGNDKKGVTHIIVGLSFRVF